MQRIDVEHVSISRGNIKMGQIPSVSLPPITSCNPKACKLCGKKCYARKISKLRPSVKQSYERNLKILLEEPSKFWREIDGNLKLATYFRFGVAGDIWDKEYLLNMAKCARDNPHCQILCFTKKYDLVNDYLKRGVLPGNLHIVFSAWKGLEMKNPNHLPEAHVMYKDGTSTAEEGKRYIYCKSNCVECISEKRSCWGLQNGEGVIFAEH